MFICISNNRDKKGAGNLIFPKFFYFVTGDYRVEYMYI